MRLLSAALPLMMLTPGCASFSDRAEPGVVAVLVDASDSRWAAALRADTESDLGSVFEAAARSRAHLIVSVFARGNRENEIVFNEPAVPACANELMCLAAKRDTRQRIVDSMREGIGRLRVTGGSGSDGLLAIGNAAADLARFRGRRTLVLLSDGLINSATFRVTAAALTERGPRRLLAHWRAAHTAPDLRGIDVYMAGLGRTARGTIGARELEGLRTFWSGFFKAAGANVRSLGAHLVRFP